MDETRRGYDEVAAAYAERFGAELDGKPLDRMLLDLVARCVDGVLADVGCGPGHVAAYLRDRGAAVVGVDLSPGMVEVAARTHPDIRFHAADMRALPAGDGEWAGIVAFYSIIHVPDLPAVFREFARVLRPGGTALVSFHVGDEVRHVEEFMGHTVSLDFHFFTRPAVEAAMTGAGLQPRAYLERRPYPAEVETTRGYVLARR